MADCLKDALKKFSDVDQGFIKDLHDSMVNSRQKAFLDGIANPDSVFRDKAMKTLEDFKRSVMVSEIKELQNIKKLNANKAFIDRDVFQNEAGGGFFGLKDSKSAGMGAILRGTNEVTEGGGQSIARRMVGYKSSQVASFLHDIGPKEMLDIWKDGSLAKEINQERWELANGRKGGVSGSDDALHLAKAEFNAGKEALRIRNSAGMFVNDLEGHVGSQSWDVESVKNLGKDGFVKMMIGEDSKSGLLDHEKTFNKDFEPQDPRKTVEAIYDKIVDEKHDLLGGDDSDRVLRMVDMPQNIAKRAERGRSMFFKDADSFWEANQAIGKKSSTARVISMMDSASRDSALVERLGTNPRATFERMTKGLPEGDQASLERTWRNIDGSANAGGSDPLAKLGSASRLVAAASKLSTALTSKVGEFPGRAAVDMVTTGKGFLKANLDSVSSFFKNIKEDQRLEIAKALGVGSDSFLHGANLAHIMDAEPGFISKYLDKITKLNGLAHFTEAGRSASGDMLATALGGKSHLGFADLDKQTGQLLRQYGIGPNEWEVARQAAQDLPSGQKVIGYQSVRGMSDDSVKSIMQKGGLDPSRLNAVSNFKNEVAQKLATYYNTMASIGINEPGVRERASFSNRGFSQDSVEGQALRFMTQFKMYPLTMKSQMWNFLAKQGGDQSYSKIIAPFVAGTISYGYLGMVMRSIMTNKTPPNPLEAKTFLESAAKGGGLGLMADLAKENYSRNTGGLRSSFLSAMAGPVLGQAEDVAQLGSDVKNAVLGQNKKPLKTIGTDAVNLMSNNLPRVPLLSHVVDTQIVDHMKEAINPGYLARKARSLRKSGQAPIIGGEGSQ